MPYFVVIQEQGPSWDDKKQFPWQQEGWDEHSKFMRALVRERFVVLGGPLEKWPPIRDLLVVDAPNEDTARSRLAEEPFMHSGVLKIVELYPWEIHYSLNVCVLSIPMVSYQDGSK